MSLNNKQQLFVESYLKCWNASEAARQAGYSTKYLNTNASKLLQNTTIKAAIEARLAEKALVADEVLFRLAAIARGNLGEFANVRQLSDLVDHPLASVVKKVKTTARKAANGSVTVVVELELYDALRALELLGKHHQLFSDAPTISVFNHTAFAHVSEELGLADELEAGPEVNGHYGQNGRVR